MDRQCVDMSKVPVDEKFIHPAAMGNAALKLQSRFHWMVCIAIRVLCWAGPEASWAIASESRSWLLQSQDLAECWRQCSVTLTSSTFSRLHTAAHRTLRTLGKIIVCIYINKYTRGLFPLFPSEEMRWDIMLVTFMMIRKAILCLTDQMSHQLIIHIRCREMNILRYTFVYLVFRLR